MNINKKGLSILKINKETRCAKICPFCMLIHKLKNPHNKKRAMNPLKNELNGLCGIRAEMIKATMAMLHQGKYKQARKLKSMMRMVVITGFIVGILVN